MFVSSACVRDVPHIDSGVLDIRPFFTRSGHGWNLERHWVS